MAKIPYQRHIIWKSDHCHVCRLAEFLFFSLRKALMCRGHTNTSYRCVTVTTGKYTLLQKDIWSWLCFVVGSGWLFFLSHCCLEKLHYLLWSKPRHFNCREGTLGLWVKEIAPGYQFISLYSQREELAFLMWCDSHCD